jgi:hypothetical protein
MSAFGGKADMAIAVRNVRSAPAGLGHKEWQPANAALKGRTAMQIEKHDKSYIVKLEDGSSWRIWPGDIALTLGWSSTTALEVSEIGR